jgi:murein DD-endopeptidase MepM/ murein hydrolase activator NlpD
VSVSGPRRTSLRASRRLRAAKSRTGRRRVASLVLTAQLGLAGLAPTALAEDASATSQHGEPVASSTPVAVSSTPAPVSPQQDEAGSTPVEPGTPAPEPQAPPGSQPVPVQPVASAPTDATPPVQGASVQSPSPSPAGVPGNPGPGSQPPSPPVPGNSRTPSVSAPTGGTGPRPRPTRHAGAGAPSTRHGRPAGRNPRSTSGSSTELAVPGQLGEPLAEALPLPLGLAGLTEDQPPAYLIPIYRDAERRYGVPWTILAAVNQIETDYGRDLSVSPAGAVGWMQFMPATWAQWGVEADGDTVADPYSPIDAIFSAARYLRASGAPTQLRAALFAYNHAEWYVEAVLVRARMLAGDPVTAPLRSGYSLPLAHRYMSQLGRTDDGVDIETAPDGALVYSMTPGVVTAVASDPAGFGPDYPVIEATSGPLAGQHIYYGHVAASLVHVGATVSAGQPIAIIGHTGDAAALGHGHIEIGFSDAAGTPLNQHGSSPATPAGEVMRSFLVELSRSFGVSNV